MPLIRCVQVSSASAPVATSNDTSTRRHRSSSRALAVALLVACTLLFVASLRLAAADDAFSSSSSTGAIVSSSTGDSSNTTATTDDTTSSSSSSLPVSNMVAVILVCAFVVSICVCLFVAARSQMKGNTASSKPAVVFNHAMQAKIEAARRGWRKAEADGGAPATSHLTLAQLQTHGVSRMEILVRANELQRMQMALLSGGTIGGLGACRYEHFRDPEDFADELWATEVTKESLRRSGCILDAVITAQHVMGMAKLSGIIPVFVLCLTPFHKLILKQLDLSDWYGPITHVDFNLIMAIAAGGTAVHLLSYFTARAILTYDRAPSIVKQRDAYRLQQIARQAAQMAAVVPAGAGGVHPMPPAGAPPLTPISSMTPVMPFIASPPPMLPAAPSIDPLPPVFSGKEPSLAPLVLMCIVTFLAFGLLGYAGFVAGDESIGRQYGLTSTSKRYWPPSAGDAPAITLMACIAIGGAAMVPFGFSLMLLARFCPRSVHPNLMVEKQA